MLARLAKLAKPVGHAFGVHTRRVPVPRYNGYHSFRSLEVEMP